MGSEMFGLLEVAARARVEGKTWAEIGQLLDRTEDTVEGWKRRHPTEWAELTVQAIDDRLPEVESEAINEMIRQLRHGDESQKAWAAKELAAHSRALRGTRMKIEASGPGGGPLEMLLKLTDEDLDAIADRDD